MLVKIKENRKWGYYNTETKYEIPCIYEDADNFDNGYAIVKASYNEYYIIDEHGNKINHTPFTHIEFHSSGVYRVRYKNIEHDSFIDQSGNFVTSLGTKLPDEINALEFIAPLTDDIYLTYSGEHYGLFHLSNGYIINNLQYISRLNDVLFVISQNESELRGVCNTSGQIIVPFEYRSFSIIDSDLILASQDSYCRAGDVYNHQGDKLFYTNSRAQSIGNGLYRIFYDTNKSFVYNPLSNEVCFSIKTTNPIPLEHLYYSEFINGFSVIINKEQKYGLIDIDNNVVINCEYEDIYIENGFAYVAKNCSYKDYRGYHKSKKVYGIIDLKNFNTIIECQFDTISSFVNHHAKVTKDYYSGYVNDQGEATIKLTHDKISETENPYIVQLSRTGQYPNIRYQFITGEYAFIHPQGHFVALPKEYQVCGDFSEGRILVQHQTSYNYAYADEFGKIVIRLNPGIEGGKFNGERASIWIDRCLYRTLYGGEDTSLCAINKAGAFVVPDGTCEVVIENSALSFIRPFEGEIARAFCDGKWVLINKTGQYISANKFDEISEFIDNQAIATIRDNNRREYHIITNNGEPLIEHKFKSIELVNGEYYSTDIGNISKNGKFIANGLEIEMLYDSCIYCNEGYILVSRGNLKGVLGSNGKKLLDCLYNNISYVGNEHLLCSTEDSFLLFNCRTNEGVKLDNIKTCKVISDNVILITRPNKDSAIINSKGDILYQEHDLDITGTYDDLVIYKRNNRSTVGIISISKGILLEDVFNSILIDTETNSILATKDDHRQRYDFNGKKVLMLNDKLFPLSDKYEACGDYYCGLARVKKHYPELQGANRKRKSPRSYRTLFHMTHHPDAQGNMDKRDFQEEKESDQILRSWGYIDTDGNEVIPCQFNNADDFSEGLAAVSYFYHWGFINTNGEFVIPRRYEKVRRFHEGHAAVKKENGIYWGYIRKDGQAAFNTRENDLYDMHCGIVRYKDYKGYGYINSEGKKIISNLEYAEDFKNDRAIVKVHKDANYQLCIDTRGNIILDLDGTEIYLKDVDFTSLSIIPEHKIAITHKKGLYGLIGERGCLLPTIYKSIRVAPDRKSLLVKLNVTTNEVKLSFEGNFILSSNKFQEETILNKKYGWCEPLSDELFLVYINNDNIGVVNIKGEELVPTKYQSICLSGNSKYILCARNGHYVCHEYGFRDWLSLDTLYHTTYNIKGEQVILKDDCHVVLEKKYIATGSYHENRCAVLDTDGWGFIDEFGNEIIPCSYDCKSDFKNGRCVVTNYPEWSVFDNYGNVILKNECYHSISDYENGCAEVTHKAFYTKDDNGEIVYDTRQVNLDGQLYIDVNEGKQLLPKGYTWYNKLTSGLIQVYDGEFWGILDQGLNVVTPCRYAAPFEFASKTFGLGGYIKNSKELHAIVSDANGFGVIDKSGDIIIPCQYESIVRKSFGLISRTFIYYAKHKGIMLHSIFNENGELLTTLPCESIEAISKQSVKFKIIGGTYGVARNNGKIIFAGLNGVGMESCNMIPVRLGGRWCYMNEHGNFIGLDKGFSSVKSFTDSIGIVSVKTDNRTELFGAINSNGDFVIPPVYDSIKYEDNCFKAEYHINIYTRKKVFFNNKGHILLVDNEGMAHDFAGYNYCEEVSDNIFLAIQDGHVGFIDANGKILIALRKYPDMLGLPYYDNGHYYIKESEYHISYDGVARCIEINEDGKLITWKSEERIALPLEYTWASIWNGDYLPVIYNDNWGIINASFQAVSPFEYKRILGIQGNYAMAIDKEDGLCKLNLLDQTSERLEYGCAVSKNNVMIIHKIVKDNSRGYFRNEKYLYGLMDYSGTELIPCKYEDITFDGFETPDERDYVCDDGYSQDELDAMYRDAFEDDPDAQWNIW